MDVEYPREAEAFRDRIRAFLAEYLPPNWPGGGTVFGPIPRSYTQIVPKQVRALAL